MSVPHTLLLHKDSNVMLALLYIVLFPCPVYGSVVDVVMNICGMSQVCHVNEEEIQAI